MPAGPSDDQNKPGQITEKLAQGEGSSKTPSTASSHPAHQKATDESGKVGDKVQLRDHQANPGPQIVKNPEDFGAQQEGTREDRLKRTEELNK